MSLQGQVAIVTGAARGIGLEISTWLARGGARVALADVQPAAVEQAAQGLRDVGLEAMSLVADVADEAQVRAAVGQVVERWGRIDILVNNAGICPMTPVEQITAAEWDLVLAINLKGPFLFCQAVIPVMRRQRSGKIVNIASSAGQMGGLAVGLHYSASKAGILGLTKSLARILAPDIQVNAVAPGTTATSMTEDWDPAALENLTRQIPAGRLGRPADVAAAVLFLASEEAIFVTGQTLGVNGGLFMG